MLLEHRITSLLPTGGIPAGAERPQIWIIACFLLKTEIGHKSLKETLKAMANTTKPVPDLLGQQERRAGI